MLSVVIPTYNYNTFPLVQEIYNQCNSCNVNFEIICIDDASEFDFENEKVNTLSNCVYIKNKKNLGRAANRNLLASKAKYNWLLFLDADVFPEKKDFIKNYINTIDSNFDIFYGGIKYQDALPKATETLRWNYGKKRESLNVTDRLKNNYRSFLTLNFIVKKSLFETVRFNENIANFRHEDTLFSFDLMTNNIPVKHIDNVVIHNGLETNEIFLKKSEESVEGLLKLIQSNLISKDYIQLSNYYFYIKKLRLKFLLKTVDTIFTNFFKKNLLSKSPSLFIFDLYRLIYLNKIDNK